MFRKPRILLVGDLLLDEWVHVQSRVANPEGAAMIVSGTADDRGMSLGGVGIAATLFKRLGASVKLMSRLSKNMHGSVAHAMMHREKIACRYTTFVDDWSMPLKRRYVNDSGMVIFRYDEELSLDHMLETAGTHFDTACYDKLVQRADCVLVLDYDKGYLSGFGRYLVERAREADTPIFVGAKPIRLREYAGADLVKVNAHEAAEFLDADYNDVTENLPKAAESLCHAVSARAAVITAGSHGAACAVMTNKNITASFALPAFSCFPAIKNCVGAGDAFFAGLTFDYVTARTRPKRTETMRNMRAAITAAGSVAAAFLESGPDGVTPSVPVLARYDLLCAEAPEAKITDLDTLAWLVQAWRKHEETVVFTNGCFDLLHEGHLRLLHEAHRQGTRFIVAVNSDDSVRKLKGNGRPVQPFATRARLLASLSCVDAVVSLDEEDFVGNTALRSMITALQPDVLVKGDEYAESEIVGWEEMVQRDPPGRVWRCPMLSGRSTTNVIQKVKHIT
jgi:D-beta-D-heptose 7-phosphate kinase/D-beta-D-heptose 1-phosphate adenosyltransferase